MTLHRDISARPGARWWVGLLVLAWLALFVYSFIQFATLEPTGSSFTRGLNRVGAWLQWQGAALMVAVVTWLLGRRIDISERGWRRLARVPALVSGLLLGGLCLLYLWLVVYANVNKPPPGPVPSGQTATQPAMPYTADPDSPD